MAIDTWLAKLYRWWTLQYYLPLIGNSQIPFWILNYFLKFDNNNAVFRQHPSHSIIPLHAFLTSSESESEWPSASFSSDTFKKLKNHPTQFKCKRQFNRCAKGKSTSYPSTSSIKGQVSFFGNFPSSLMSHVTKWPVKSALAEAFRRCNNHQMMVMARGI